MVKYTRFIGALALACFITVPVYAATVFNDSSSFSAAAGSVTTVDFQGCPAGQSLATNATVSSSGPCSGIPDGVTFSAPTGFNLYIAETGQSANPNTSLGLDFPRDGAISIVFAALQTTFGTDLFQNFGGGTQSGQPAVFTLRFFNGAALLDTYTVNVASGTGTFFGVTGSTAFNDVRISQAGGFAVIDNVKFLATAGAVPEPTTWMLMLIGMAGVGFSMRRTVKLQRRVRFA